MCRHTHTHTCACIMWCVWVLIPLSLYTWLRVAAMQTRSWDPNLITEDQNPIRTCVCCGSDRLAIRRPINGMIRRFLPVRAVKTRRWFGSKTASFHVSVCFCVIFLFIVINAYSCSIHIISCDHLIYYTNMFTCITSWDISEHSPYLFCWSEYLLASFHV